MENQTTNINLKLADNTIEEFSFLQVRYSKAQQLFEEFKEKEQNKTDEKTLFRILKDIIELVETNPTYNFYFLKYHVYEKEYTSLNKLTKKNEIFTYKYNLEELGPILSEENYKELTKKNQSNPAIELYNLIALYISDINLFVRKTEKLKYSNLNCPLIESSERARVLYYKNFFSKPRNDEQKRRLSNLMKGIKYLNSVNLLNDNLKNWLESIELDQMEINKELFLFMIDLELIGNISIEKKKKIKKIYEKKFRPLKGKKYIEKRIKNNKKDLLKNMSSDDEDLKVDNKVEKKNEEKNDNKEAVYNDTKENKYKNEILLLEKDSNFNYSNFELLSETEFKVYNSAEEFVCKINDYIIDNLKEDIKQHENYPLRYLLEKNQTINYFLETNKNLINDEKLFNDFKEYFKSFITSNVVKEALSSSGYHENVIKLLESDYFPAINLDSKYVFSLPLLNEELEGYTNKDFLVSVITSNPFFVTNYGKIKNNEDYNNLKNVIFIFNIAIKLLICLHEVIIHLAYGYLFYLSEGKIESKSPKLQAKNKDFNYANNPCVDGGSYFEYLLFGKRIKKIKFNFVMRLLNGNFSDLEKFKEELKKPIDLTKEEKFGDFLQKILENHPINSDFNYETIEASIRSKYNELQYVRTNYYPDCIKI